MIYGNNENFFYKMMELNKKKMYFYFMLIGIRDNIVWRFCGEFKDCGYFGMKWCYLFIYVVIFYFV